MKCINLLLLFIFTFYLNPATSFSQNEIENLKDLDEFYCAPWLPDLVDTFEIFRDFDSVNQMKAYCVLTKKKISNYNICCWTGKPGLEQPTEWKPKLKLKFKKQNMVLIKFGKKRKTYHFLKRDDGTNYLSIKREVPN